MKKTAFYILGLLLIASLSCTKTDDLRPGFDMPYQLQFEIPAGIGPFVVHHFYLRDIPTRYTQLLTQQGKVDSDIAGISTLQAVLQGVFGDENYDFIDDVSVRVYKEPDESNYIEVAYRQPVPLNPGNNLPLIPSLADSKQFMSGGNFSVDIALRLRKTTQFQIPTRLDLQFRAVYQ
jgi:hypothetical protein